MNDPKKLFLDVISLPEEKDNPDLDTGDLMEDALKDYDMHEIIRLVGDEEFKENYMLLIDDIKKEEFNIQKNFLNGLLKTICNYYKFDFIRKININDEYELKRVYDFIEMFMFRYVDFYANVWNKMIDWSLFYNLDIYSYVTQNPFGFMKSMEESINELPKEELYTELLMTLPAAKILDLFITFSIISRKNITLKIIEMNLEILTGREEVNVSED